MNLVKLSFKNLISKPLNALLSLLLLVLSVALVTFMLQLSDQVKGNLDKNIKPVDLVVGAKGSPLQLVLSSVLHIDAPTGNIKLKDAEKLRKSRLVKTAVPVSYGDNYKGVRILGTETSYLKLYNAELATGELFSKSQQVVLGSTTAKKLQLKIGDTFLSSHGLADQSLEEHHGHPFKVAGILKPTGSVVDNLIITNLESIWDVHGHAEEKDDEHHHEEDLEVTSLLIQFSNPMAMMQLPRYINDKTNMQAALPSLEINRLVKLLGVGVQTIQLIAIAILLVSGLSIFISLLKAIRERRQELALLRTYGATATQLLWLVLLEGLFLGFIGYVIGWLIGRCGLWIISNYAQNSYGYTFNLATITKWEAILLLATLGITVVASVLASLSVFKLNVSKILSSEK
ncbi:MULTISPECIES: ABC transporter permease [unclassified Cellulophaga]|uniref:ABC transporter permease n=1 Tax=unclassified Cellulophaga TaxID=2634405 RepID=UPI0026E16986|nr:MULTISPECIES: FtsX-like permease family protein [unclassified Cellulophaga]MDO6489974.1 ABC transporter permease [Cellulophaga sp. 2_MG-2023]MDO6494832.1 ABC transporter permease [Cellulophaga sp. 3_MG-2023]